MPQSSEPDRQFFIHGDIKIIPYSELGPFCKSGIHRLITGLKQKIGKVRFSPKWAAESRRLVAVKSDNVSKRLMKYFSQLQKDANELGFTLDHFARTPTIGPITSARMVMGERSGQSYFFAAYSSAQEGGSIKDDGHFGFASLLPDNIVMTTLSPSNLPNPCQWNDRRVSKSDSVKAIHGEHQKRVRGKKPTAIPQDKLFAFVEKLNAREVDDLLKRGVIRTATPAEVARIRKQRG